MSSRPSRKSKNPRAKAPEPIITRTKSAQQKRQLRTKEEKKTEKPESTKPETKSPRTDIKLSKPETKSPDIKLTKPETKSPRSEAKSSKPETNSPIPNKTVKRPQVSLLKPIKVPDEVVDQIEYYPNTLKRDFRAKKIMLKPKHNFKVIAATNKRKMATPQKGIKSSSSKNSPLSPKGSRFSTRASSPELSMQDMVRMMEETRSLSDEDFMEILTCPSPVWWEDPPDGGIDEGTIHKRKSEPPPKKITKETKKRKITNKTTNKRVKKNIVINLVDDVELPKEKAKNSDERFVKKKQKLENILGNLKNKATQPKENDEKSTRDCSESEGDFSDLSFNEEEILKNLENMEIPIEETPTESTDGSLSDAPVAPKNDNSDRSTPLICIPVIQEVFSLKSSVFDSSDFKSDVSLEEINFPSDTKSDEIVILDRCTNSSLSNNDDSSSIIDLVDNNSDMGKNSPIENNLNLDDIKNSDATKNDDVPTKKTKVLSEYISVYKITPEKQKSENNTDVDTKPAENNAMTKLEAVRGKLNDFFKQCKSNNRLKKTENVVPANPVTDVKEEPINKEKENGDIKIDLDDEKNRLKSCDYCVQKTENGTKDFSCEKCEMAPILACGLCNFLADSKEVYKKHVSSCKDVARISWSHNYVLNQT